MRRTKTGVLPSVDVAEPRLLLSTAAPLLSRHELTGVVHEVRTIVSTLAKTQNTSLASAQLTGLALEVSSRSPGLALSWQSDLALYHPHSARSIMRTQKAIITDLYIYNQSAGDGPVSGTGSTSPVSPSPGAGGGTGPVPSPTPTPSQGTTGTPISPASPSLDSVRIENTTGMTIQVTIELELPQVQKPTITETIPAQGDTTMLFDFGTDTGDFMTMNVSRAAGGGQSPPPWDNINLSQPLSGYDGTTFMVSLFGSYFSVNVPT